MGESDAWKLIGGIFATAISVIMGWFWTKVTNSVQKDDFQKHVEVADRKFEKLLEQMRIDSEKFRETTRDLYAAAESDRRQHYHAIAEVKDRIHEAQNTVMIEIGKLRA